MKNSILRLSSFALVAGTIFTSCSNSSEKVENAEKNVAQANIDLAKANDEYTADLAKYKQETDDKINANMKSIEEFNTRIEHEKKEAKADYKKKIAELEQKNTDMKKKMDEYKAEGKEKWETFKTEFSNEMDALGKSFKELTTSKTH